MIASLLANSLNENRILGLGFIIVGVLTYLMLNAKFSFLPHDQGRAYAINGALSKGKLRGVGLIVVLCYALISLLFVKVTVEYVIMCVLLVAIMLSGYLDDASKIPWSDYKKGAIDLVISIVAVGTFIYYNSTTIHFFGAEVTLHPALYGFLGIVLIWISINVVNCSDGVDGLCATLTLVSVASFVLIFGDTLGDYVDYSLILMGAIAAYLFFNCSPSSQLMGDAGSRAFGFFLAILAMKSGHPFAFLLLVLVMILDGGLGLAKIFLLRFLKIHILKNTRTPLHDEMRKNRSWSDTQVVFRFTILQVLCSAIMFVLIG